MDLSIEEKATVLGRTFAAVDNFIRTYQRRPDDPYGVKGNPHLTRPRSAIATEPNLM